MTLQIKDVLIFGEKRYRLNEQLLERYFREFPEKKPNYDFLLTSCWRGYVATFEIREDQLFVKELDFFQDDETNTRVCAELFPNDGKFDWFSGLIRIDDFRGEFDEETGGSVFEYLEIFQGDFIRKRVMDFEELKVLKEYQFEYFKSTKEYEKVYSMWKNNNPNMEHDKIEEYIYNGLLQMYSQEMFDL